MNIFLAEKEAVHYLNQVKQEVNNQTLNQMINQYLDYIDYNM